MTRKSIMLYPFIKAQSSPPWVTVDNPNRESRHDIYYHDVLGALCPIPAKLQNLAPPLLPPPPLPPRAKPETENWSSKSYVQVVRLTAPYFPLPSMRSVTSACMLRTYSHAKHHAPYQPVYGKPAGRDSSSVSPSSRSNSLYGFLVLGGAATSVSICASAGRRLKDCSELWSGAVGGCVCGSEWRLVGKSSAFGLGFENVVEFSQ